MANAGAARRAAGPSCIAPPHRTVLPEERMSWTDERVETLKKMWAEGQSASQIAKELGGVTRNAVIGKVHRLGLSNRAGAGPVAGGPAPAAPASRLPPRLPVRVPQHLIARPAPAPRSKTMRTISTRSTKTLTTPMTRPCPMLTTTMRMMPTKSPSARPAAPSSLPVSLFRPNPPPTRSAPRLSQR